MFTRLYLHIPFCQRKCPYCSFVSHQGSRQTRDDYLELLLKEMDLARTLSPAGSALDSVYFGGGTPSLLQPAQMALLLERASRLFGLAESAEITLEANPGTIDLKRLVGFRAAGINRLSLGIQSFDDSRLVTLGRIHSAQQAQAAFNAARQAGFDNIGIDLIHSLPDQTLDMWRSDLHQALRLAPEHLSVYGLTIEEDTPFAERYPDDSPHLPDEDLSADMFEQADTLLTAAGYEHYEIANYARPGFRSRHNSGYWHRDGYLGLGCGAHSFLRDSVCGTRFSNSADLEAYSAAIRQGHLPRLDLSALSRKDAMAEFVYLGLRMADGIQITAFENEFGSPLNAVYGKVIDELAQTGLIITDRDSVRLSRRGLLLSNQVFTRFLP